MTTNRLEGASPNFKAPSPSLTALFFSFPLYSSHTTNLDFTFFPNPNPNQICSDQLNPLPNLPSPPSNSSAVTVAESSLVILTASFATSEATPVSSPSTALFPSPVSSRSLSLSIALSLT